MTCSALSLPLGAEVARNKERVAKDNRFKLFKTRSMHLLRTGNKERVVKDNRYKQEWSAKLLTCLASLLQLSAKGAADKERVVKDNRLKWHAKRITHKLHAESKERVVKDNRYKLKWSAGMLACLALSVQLGAKAARAKARAAKDNRLKLPWPRNMQKLSAEISERVAKDNR